MKRKTMSIISVCLYALALLLFVTAITVTGGGSLLDFSGLIRFISCCLSVLCVIAATFLWKTPDTNNKKKIIVLVVLIAIIIAGGILDSMYEDPATEYVSIDLPFDVEDIEFVEMYRYEDTPENAQKKVVTKDQSILYLYTTFEECLLQEKQFMGAEDASVTCFRFVLDDGSCYELIYHGIGVKKGYLQSTTGGYTYFTPADIGWNWDMLDSTLVATPAAEDEIPGMD